MILAVTGHRPEKLGGYGPAVAERLFNLASSELQGLRPEYVLTGMAIGWDQAVADACQGSGDFWLGDRQSLLPYSTRQLCSILTPNRRPMTDDNGEISL